MEAFRSLPWSMQDAGTDLEQCYTLDMREYSARNPHDVFFNHLYEIDPIHYSHLQPSAIEANTLTPENSTDISPKRFADPRTGVEVEKYFCRYNAIDRTKGNIFMRNHIEASKLNRTEHSACLNAIRSLLKAKETLTNDERSDRFIYESTAEQRSNEQKLFLQKIREHFVAKKSSRFHSVPAAVDYFIVKIWKQRLIELYRQSAGIHYRVSTALTLSPNTVDVRVERFHQEHLGNVPALTNQNVRYVLQSTANLLETYQQRKSKHFQALIEKKTQELIKEHNVDFVIPISVLSLILCDEKDWQFRMRVQESESSTIYNPKKRVCFEKPFPALYLNGNRRYMKGAKYLLRHQLRRNAATVFSHAENKEISTGVLTDDNAESEAKEKADGEYKISTFDEFMKNYRTKVAATKISHENISFTIFELSGKDEEDDSTEVFRVLVPSKQDAYRRNANGDIEFVRFSPKIERQPEYGCEIMTKNELLHEWCQIFFRPDSTIERVRFDYEIGRIMHRQSLQQIEIESEMEQRYGTERPQLLQKLWSVLQTFSGFPPGDYLLQNSSKLANCIKVYEKADKSAETINIPQIFKDAVFERNHFDPSQWQPIDDSVITELCEKHQILPCAFPHAEYLNEHNVKPMKDDSSKYVKTPSQAYQRRQMKINPADDSKAGINLTKNREEERKKVVLKFKAAKKQRTQKRRNVRLKEKLEATKNEVDGLKEAKTILENTMDQYSTLSGNDLLNELINTKPGGSQSIATRTRRSISSPKVQYTVRRSGRVAKTKKQLDF